MLVRADDDDLGVALARQRDQGLVDRDLGILGDDERLRLEPQLTRRRRGLLGPRRAASSSDSSISRAVRRSSGAGGSPALAAGSSTSSNTSPDL